MRTGTEFLWLFTCTNTLLLVLLTERLCMVSNLMQGK